MGSPFWPPADKDYPVDGIAFWVAALAASVLVGMSKGGIPVVGMLGVPVLSLTISPVAAAGLLLPVYVVSDLIGLYTYRREYDKRVIAIVVPGMMLGIGMAWATARAIPIWAITSLVGLIGVIFVLSTFSKRRQSISPQPSRVAPGVFWGSVTGFVSFLVHSGAPPFQVYTLPLKLPKMVFAGTTTIAFACCNAAKLVPYYFLDQLNPTNLQIAGLLAVPASIAVFAGVRLVRVVPEKLFYQVVTWVLLIVSGKLLWDGLLASPLLK